MSIWVDLAKVSTGANVLLLLVLGYIWGRNYLTFRSKHTLGLLIFSVFLLLENALVLYYYLVDPTLSGWWHDQVSLVWRAQMLIHGLQTFGLAFLAWVSWD